MQVLQVNKNDCLVMDLDFSIAREVLVAIIDYLKNVIADFPEDIMRIPPHEEVRELSGECSVKKKE